MSTIKEGLLADMDRRVADHILERQNAELLKKLIAGAADDNEAMAIAELGTTYKRTGLHFDKRLERMTNSIHYLRRVPELSFSTDPQKPTHRLVIGDNYPALQNLLVQYRGEVDVIYIDPPYGKDSMGEFAKTNYENAISRDNLLSMLWPRLQLAKMLLSDTGVIFCSIDDRNQAYVKCLFDEVFGEGSFVASAPRKTGAGDAATRSASELRKPYDYVLVYRGGKDTVMQKKVVGEKEYKYEDSLGRYRLERFQASGSDATRSAHPNLYYPIYVLKNGSITTKPSVEYEKIILPNRVNGEDGRWMWKTDKFERDKDSSIFYDGENVYRKIYYDETEDQNKYQVEKAWIDGSEYRNANGTKELEEILMRKNAFKNPKPKSLVEWCIKLIPQKESILVLDFFAGSGTTGHAVLELNRQEEEARDLFDTGEKGQRQFILVQMDEKTDATPNGIARDVTAERLRRIMTGKASDGTADFDWIKRHTPYGGNLEVLEVATVANFEGTEGRTPADVIDETVYGLPPFAQLRDKMDWLCANFIQTQKSTDR